jgi:hypothetical protein
MPGLTYNYYANVQAARLARLIGKDPAPYETEARLIARGMREYLWMPDRGVFGEFRDYLGLQLLIRVRRFGVSIIRWTRG